MCTTCGCGGHDATLEGGRTFRRADALAVAIGAVRSHAHAHAGGAPGHGHGEGHGHDHAPEAGAASRVLRSSATCSPRTTRSPRRTVACCASAASSR